MTPTGMPIASQISPAPSASVNVTTMRPPSSDLTDSWLTNENPSPGQPYASPRNRCFTNSRYWMYTG